jgi:CRP/FNR family transcriptional regulator, cyclic AMP receptor protein
MSGGTASRGFATARLDPRGVFARSHVLLEDLDLYETLPPPVRDRAVEECVAEIVSLAPGAWPEASRSPQLCVGGPGLLLLDGLVLCRRGIEGRFGAELLGEGDLLRPSQETENAQILPLRTSRKVLAPTRVAVLDLAFAERLSGYPQLAEELLARAINRSRNLVALMAIAHQPRIDVRLHTLFWHLASRWGRMRADGVLVPLPLTHAVLADLVAARRPTVSSALAELSRRRLLTVEDDGWHLSGDPPCELYELASKPLPSTLAA